MSNFTVYKHTSPSGKVYIGITSQEPAKRWANGKGYKHSPHFRAAIEKYGWEAFKHEILAEGLTREAAEEMEVALIAQYNSSDRGFGYNAEKGGSLPGRASEETRQKISERQKGEKHHYYGKHLSEEHRQKLSVAHKGKKLPPRSEEHRRRLSEASKGKHPSEETRRKLREAKTGKHPSEETRRKMSAAQRERYRREREEVIV